ncbi:MAG: hypothetical protein M3Q48_01085 [Actinomycetota bacterium]|nr:hypothetical protein [Actinomycetota bacterium]
MSCPNCKVSGLVEIVLTVGKREVTMRSCSGCDTRWWASDGRSLRLEGVLALASAR